MTKGELLLYWLTHVREGSWPSFRRALQAVEAGDEQLINVGKMRSQLSELAHVEFFICGTNRWQTFAPLLGGLCGSSGVAALCGGRTPRLVEILARSCDREGCLINVAETPDSPDQIQVAGSPEALPRVARDAGIPYVPNLAAALSIGLEPIQVSIRAAVPGAGPINWSVRSFDLRTLRWVDGLLPDTAYEYQSRHGGRRYYVRAGKHELRELDRRTAVYAAGHFNQLALLSYSEETRRLMVPWGVPLPEAMARVAAACSGSAATVHEGRLVYDGVPAVIASVLMAATGQRPPDPHWLSEERSPG
jgi:hypothetical protein